MFGENGEGACRYHPGKPIFHDLKKGWACCNKIVYDWDEFKKIETCAIGRHDETVVEYRGQSQFQQSNESGGAGNPIKKEEVKVKSIEEHNE